MYLCKYVFIYIYVCVYQCKSTGRLWHPNVLNFKALGPKLGHCALGSSHEGQLLLVTSCTWQTTSYAGKLTGGQKR